MEDNINEIATHVLIDVLERFAFALGDPADPDEIGPPAGPASLARMSFNGPFAGSLTLLMPNELGADAAANLLSLEPDDPALDRHAIDAIKEILNVVCGNLLTELAGEDPVFDLSAPEVELATPEAWKDLIEEDGLACVLVEDWPVLLQIQIERAPS